MLANVPVPFLDLRAQLRAIGPELHAAVARVVDGGQYVLGPEVAAFESAFARHCGTRHAVAVSSGTAALHLSLLACDIGPGCEVITVPATFVATVAAILYAGATPRFVDIDPVTWTMDPAQVEQAITPRTRALLPVHLHGRLADMHRLGEIARRHGLRIIEDAAQAHGAARHGRRAGHFGNLGCFSFYPGKNLGALGEGGAVVTDDDALAERLRLLRDWGQAERYRHVVAGFNYRMDAIQGAALAVKLPHLDDWTAARRACAGRYQALLSALPVGRPLPAGEDHVWHVYAIRAKQRDAVRAALQERGIATGLHYPIPVHMQPAYARLGGRPGDFPVAEALARETLSLPIFPELTDAQGERVVAALAQACRERGLDAHAA